MIDFDESRQRVEAKVKASDDLVASLLETAEFRDEDGYPTDEFLRIVLNWTWHKPQKELFDLIHGVWWMPDWGWEEGLEPSGWNSDKKVYQYHISTGGWSGNESIIQAMKQNEYFLWSKVWVQSRRGGHYIFELEQEDE